MPTTAVSGCGSTATPQTSAPSTGAIRFRRFRCGERAQFFNPACQAWALGITDIELVPAHHVAARPHAGHQLHTNAETFEQAGSPNHILRDRPLVAVLLDATVLQSPDRPIVTGEHDPSQQTIEMELAVLIDR